MIKVVLFDVDGVLANAEPFSRQLERDYGITQRMVGPFFQERFQECLVGKADLKEELSKRSGIERFFGRGFLFFRLQRPPLCGWSEVARAGLP